MQAHIFLLLALSGCSLALVCRRIEGNLKQIDAGNGQVFGVDDYRMIYTRHGDTWQVVPGRLAHVTVGPAGVWGIDNGHTIYKMLGGSWAIMAGQLKQIDAGGDRFVSGVSMNDNIFCVEQHEAINAASYDSPVYNNFNGSLKYYSCGPEGCWGVSSFNNIYFRSGVTPSACAGTGWVRVAGKLAMIEVGTDGSVYGVNDRGQLYRRDGISDTSPTGTVWTNMNIGGKTFKHVTTDLGQLWLIAEGGDLIQCQ